MAQLPVTKAADAALSELPALPVPLVMRQELLTRMLRDQPRVRVWEIVAPAGYGKTALLTQAARHEWRGPRRLRWLTLGPAYDTPDQLVEALGTVQGTDLFLDDVDALRNPECWRVLTDFVGSVSEDSRLFLAARSECDLKLGRLELAGIAARWSERELRMSQEELLALCADCPAADVSGVLEAAEGWAAGARALAMAGTGWSWQAPEVAGIARIPDPLARYFEEQVLHSLSESQLRLMMELAVLERFSASIVRDLPGSAWNWHDLLELKRKGLFLRPLDDNEEWHRLHGLLATFLRRQLRRMASERERSLHRFAAEWFQTSGYPTEAVRHAHACGDREFAAAVVERAGAFRLSMHQGVSVLRQDAEPPGRAHEYPLLTLGQIYLKAQDGRFEEARAQFNHLRAATHEFQALRSSGREADVDSLVDVLDMVLRVYEDQSIDAPEIDILERHLEHAMDNDPVMLASLASILCVAYSSCGRVRDAYAICELGLGSLRHHRADHVLFYLHMQQARVTLMLGRPKESMLHIEHAQSLSRRAFGERGHGEAIVDVMRGVLYYENNDLDAAARVLASSLRHEVLLNGWFELYANGFSAAVDLAALRQGEAAVATVLNEAEIIARQKQLQRLADYIQILRLREATRVGNLPYAVSLLESETISQLTAPGTTGPAWGLRLRNAALIEGARLLLRMNRLREAADYLRRMERRHVQDGDTRLRFSFEVLAMTTAFKLRRHQEAFDTFVRAAELALEAGFTRQLLNHRDSLLEVFEWAMNTGRPMSSRITAFCGSALRHADATESGQTLQRRLIPKRRAQSTSEVDLSAREAEILSLVAEGLSTKEIAYRLGVSVSTVKTHRKKIYQKLGVNRRSQAIALARAKLIV
ncbi:LuxR C-terminal-related transcriptional regulator [Steroidobacter flavus]|uniref:LuxR C-terminal-related transcriptional regulator n=1 Tax=Steroidobacter flavus TaxID=1842136 RepID=A0ABV8T478_9GAMM